MKFSNCEIVELNEDDLKHLDQFAEKLSDLGDYTEDQIWDTLKGYCDENQLKTKDFSNMIRMVMTGRRFHVGVQTILYVLGVEQIKKRINWAYNFPNIMLERVDKTS